jgi:hypothetical protein
MHLRTVLVMQGLGRLGQKEVEGQLPPERIAQLTKYSKILLDLQLSEDYREQVLILSLQIRLNHALQLQKQGEEVQLQNSLEEFLSVIGEVERLKSEQKLGTSPTPQMRYLQVFSQLRAS